jgi:hypothetical protein
MDRTAAAQRLLRYYLAGAETARKLLRDPGTSPVPADGPPLTSAEDAIDWIDQEWVNLLAVVESGNDGDEEVVQLARLAAEFSEGTRSLGPAALSRLVRLVV